LKNGCGDTDTIINDGGGGGGGCMCQAMSALGIPELCFPLVAIVDFRGYRLLASSRLPLGTDTLKYGR
jgi:hypothetical protein